MRRIAALGPADLGQFFKRKDFTPAARRLDKVKVIARRDAVTLTPSRDGRVRQPEVGCECRESRPDAGKVFHAHHYAFCLAHSQCPSHSVMRYREA